MTRSVIKHSYIKGRDRIAKAIAHINYIQYRSGEDRGKEPRKFFDDKRDGILGIEVKEELKRGGKYIHKVILSPGVEGVDVKAYARAIFSQLGREKGLDLNWKCIEHNNTDHPHGHAMLFSKDKQGKEVQLRREDHAAMREFGDRYMARHHEYDRYLDRDLEKFMQSPEYNRTGDAYFKGLLRDLKDPHYGEREFHKAREWDREKALKNVPEREKIHHPGTGKTYTKYSKLDDLRDFSSDLEAGNLARISKSQYQMLYSWKGSKERGGEDFHEREAREKWDEKEKKREQKLRRLPGEDEREFNKLNEDWKRALKDLGGDRDSESFGKGYKQRQREAQGRLGSDHGHYTAGQEIQDLKKQAEADPSRKEEIDLKIEEIKKWDQEQRNEDGGRWRDLDEMLGDRYDREQRELAQMLKQRETPLPVREPGQEKTPEKSQEQTPEDQKAPNKSQEKSVELEKNTPTERSQELERKLQDMTPNSGRWKDLDDCFGERFGRGDYDDRQLTKEVEHQQGQQQVRQFQDLTIGEAQKPVLEHEGPDRDDGEELFAQGYLR